MRRTILCLIAMAIVAGNPARIAASEFDLFRAASAVYKGAKAYTLTPADIRDIVKSSVRQLDASNHVAPASSAYTKRLNRLTSNFRSVNGVPLNFKVYITNDVNAFACADGSIRVYSGIMDLMTDNELLGIIGHEIGHIGMEHSYKAIKQQLMNSALIDAAGSVSSTIATLSDYQVLCIGEAMISAKYSRKQETQADEYGYTFLKKAGKNPYSMILAFEKMQKLDKSSSSSRVKNYFTKMFSTHPQMNERIKHLQGLCDRDGYRRP